MVGRMPVFDRWVPLAEGSELREDNPYALDATKGGDGGLDDSEPPSPVEGKSSALVRRRSMVVFSDDEMEDSDAGPQASPPQHPEAAAERGEGETRGHPLQVLTACRKASGGSGEILKEVLPKAVLLRRSLPKREWIFIGRYGASITRHGLLHS